MVDMAALLWSRVRLFIPILLLFLVVVLIGPGQSIVQTAHAADEPVTTENSGPGNPWGGVCVSDGLGRGLAGPDGSTPKGEYQSGVPTVQGLECLLANLLNVFLALIGIAAFIMVVVASLRWLLAGGNSKEVETARHTLTFAIIGIVVALSAFIVLNLLSIFTGVGQVTMFTIPRSTDTYGETVPTTGGTVITCGTGYVSTPTGCTWVGP